MTGGENDHAQEGPQSPERPVQGPTQQAAASGNPPTPKATFKERVNSFFALVGQKFRNFFKRIAFWRRRKPEVQGTTA
jgi:hypothetical protein